MKDLSHLPILFLAILLGVPLLVDIFDISGPAETIIIILSVILLYIIARAIDKGRDL